MSRNPPQHGARRQREAGGLRRSRGRFGAVALAVAGLLGLGAGAGTALAAIDARVLPESAASPGTDVGAQASPGTDGGSDASARASSTPSPTATPTPVVTPEPTESPEPTGPVLSAADLSAGLLSTAEPTAASGELAIVAGNVPAPDPSASSIRTVRVEVEVGLDIDGPVFADMVMASLNDPRGWGAGGTISFARTDGDAEIRVVLASPDLVDAMCAPLNTNGIYSCGRYGHAAINHTRWVSGTDEFPDMTVYRQYVVNHEVGHLLGHPHETCPAAGELAPLMQQQTIAVAPCLPNAWPYPDGL
ncbi:DUF3152 domain-containing protein [Actinotalea sp.]|uniref:DUF3152 domain-containing protein n=1 Tax=Actinotalea sp. TaxID=1872145 RepID=UPI003564D18F